MGRFRTYGRCIAGLTPGAHAAPMSIAPDIIAAAQASAAKWRVPASVSLAQYGIESAWGHYEPPGSNNGFGIQALPGLPSVAAKSHEYRGGYLIPVTEHFAVFASIADAFDKHAELLATARVYRAAMAFPNDPDNFVKAMAHIYASAKNYESALLGIMKADNLYAYDLPI